MDNANAVRLSDQGKKLYKRRAEAVERSFERDKTVKNRPTFDKKSKKGEGLSDLKPSSISSVFVFT